MANNNKFISDNGFLFFSGATQISSIDSSGNEVLPGASVSGLTFLSSNTANPAASGMLRLASGDAVKFRNNANNADVALSKDASDQLAWAGTSFLSASAVLLAAGFPALTGDITTSAGSLATTMAASISGAKTFSTSLTSPAFISTAVNPASGGVIRLGNTESISWRNAASNANVNLIVDGSNLLNFGGGAFTVDPVSGNTVVAGTFNAKGVTTIGLGTTQQHSLNTLLQANGAQVATMTNLPAAAASTTPAGWIKISVNGTTSYMPFWQ